jgi:acyl-coenzyme A synthetase/AMP-(fatty) acid ligase/acyl carrier protein
MTMYDIFRSVFQRYADKIAVITDRKSFSFAQLQKHVDLCSKDENLHELQTLAICCESRLDFIVLMLTAIKLNKPFLPIDPHRTNDAIQEQLSTINEAKLIYGLDAVNSKPLLREMNINIQQRETIPSSIMSFMFTSGSTGTPKCVMVPRAGVINLLHQPTFFNLEEKDIFATYSPLSFDASTFEIFTPLLNGNSLVILNKFDVLDSNELYEKINSLGITCMWVTAGLFNEQILANKFKGLTAVKKLFVGGDKVLLETAKTYLTQSANNQLFNGYGPTENTVFTSVAILSLPQLEQWQKVPIGKMVDGVEGILLNDDSQIVEGAGEGILYISGRGLSPGYFKNPESTQLAFLKFAQYPGQYFYNTGDRVERNENDTLFFVGRKDRQIKLNGYRVDLNVLEEKCYRLKKFEHIVLYFSAQHAGLTCIFKPLAGVSNEDAIATLKNSLNDYEKPRFFVTGVEWSLSENGKLDIKTIIEQAEQLYPNDRKIDHALANNKKTVSEIISELLKIPVPDKSMKFFDAGFDSVTLVRLQAAITTHYQLDISLLDLYEIGTISALENSLMNSNWTDEHNYYLQQTKNTNQEQYSYFADNVPDDIQEIFRIARNVVEHHAGINTAKISLDRYAEMEIDRVADIFAILHRNGVRDITQPIALKDKVVGNCFNISKVAVSLLRAKGIPARIRYAYCTYFYDDFNHEQALVEYWDVKDKKWRRGDASMNEEIMEQLKIKVKIDLLNVSQELSQSIADVWIGCRKGTLSFESYGASVDTRKRGGLGHVAHKLTHDLACLNQLELMACDFIAPPKNYLKSRNLKLEQFDNLALILKDHDYKVYQYEQKQVPFCATPRRILRKSRFTGVTLI